MSTTPRAVRSLGQPSFKDRHIGPDRGEREQMLQALKCKDLGAFIDRVVPEAIRLKTALALSAFPAALSEREALARLGSIAAENEVQRSFIGLGYYDCITPPVIQRNILENPSWYTHYTPYQPEISQGRLEALLNYQTLITDLTGLPVANASLLDEATAAAEAMALSWAVYSAAHSGSAAAFFVAEGCHPQTKAVVRTRAEALGIEIFEGELSAFRARPGMCGALVQYPDTYGRIEDINAVVSQAHAAGALVTVACDLLSLALLRSPGSFDADIAVGSSQRFGVPLGYGGPHAAFFAVKDQYKRLMPGRLIGVSVDAQGGRALRLSLQTREQHIRREKATSNICTAQVLLAVMAGMYAVYHGPEGLVAIASEVHAKTRALARALARAGAAPTYSVYFDTLLIERGFDRAQLQARAAEQRINLRYLERGVTVSLDETTTARDLADLVYVFSGSRREVVEGEGEQVSLPLRSEPILVHEVFQRYRTETEMLRYIKQLEKRDLSLADSMIPLGSCTMKLNATAEMIPVTWMQFGKIHPFAPLEQARGYQRMIADLERALSEITGFEAVSLQPNAGSQGEYAGLLAIRGYHRSRGDLHRTVCLIPKSAHGTNPASAVMAGMQVVVVNCDGDGNVDLADLTLKVREHGAALAALMVTYPSTHGVFEERIREIAELVHGAGGQVYMDGANLNAQVGLCSPASIGADVCHINLHKTFCIPHGGGGPGMGPIAVRAHLAPFLPSHPCAQLGHQGGVGPVSAAPWGSASILPIPWMYIAMMAGEGLTEATCVAILNANYIAQRLEGAYPVLYRGARGFVAHECIIDLRPLKRSSGIEAEDVAKRLMDYGFHAPTVSFPVAGTLMIEPTESESKEELDRFCEAMLAIREEIRAIEEGRFHITDNPLKNAPHTAQAVCRDEWPHQYSRELAAYPAPWSRQVKFWPSVARVDATYGDRNLVCTCAPIESYVKA